VYIFHKKNHDTKNEETSELNRYKNRRAAIVFIDFEKAYGIIG
jgi:hypothetical protein